MQGAKILMDNSGEIRLGKYYNSCNNNYCSLLILWNPVVNLIVGYVKFEVIYV